MSDPQPEGSTALAQVVPLEQSPINPDDLPLVPSYREVRDLAAMAVTLSYADCVPGPLRGKPNSVFMVLLSGRDIGIKLTVALRMLHVIDGQVTVPPKLKLALVRERGLGRVWPADDNDATKATWYAERHDQPGVVFSSAVTWEEAAKVVLRRHKDTGEPTLVLTQKDNWQNYPARMLSWRALGYLLDDAFSEVATGLYSPDEIGAVTDEEGTPLDVIDVDPFAGMTGPARRKKEPPISEAEVGQLLVGIAALPEAGRDVLRQAWKEKRLPSPDRLAPSHMVTVKALMDWVEKRARGGDWGPWPPDPPADPPPDENAADGTTAAKDPGDGPGSPSGGGEGVGEVTSPAAADPTPCGHGDWKKWTRTSGCVYCGCGTGLYRGTLPTTGDEAAGIAATLQAAAESVTGWSEGVAEAAKQKALDNGPGCVHPETVELDDGEVCVACGERLLP